MRPYYEDDSVTLYHGDSLEQDAWLAADVLVTDPPYGSQLLSPGNGNAGGYGRRYVHSRGRTGATIAGDESTASRDAVLAAWGADRPLAFFASPRMPEPEGDWTDRIVWDKRRPGMNAGPFRYIHEMIYARGMVRADNGTFSIISALPDQKDHIHAKPIQLMQVLVKVCPPGVIADPFAGSGSTLVAAKNLGRKAIGVELDERYCELIAKRLAQDVLDFGLPNDAA